MNAYMRRFCSELKASFAAQFTPKFRRVFFASLVVSALAGVALALCTDFGRMYCFPHPSDERKPLRISCVNNLKQIGLSVRIWCGDHNEQFPWNVSTNAGGTRELCATNADGLDSNSFLHFEIVSNELATPKTLICPSDTNNKYATNFASLSPHNVTYRLHIVPDVTNEDQASKVPLITCPIDGNVLYYDAHVQPKNPDEHDRNAMKVN